MQTCIWEQQMGKEVLTMTFLCRISANHSGYHATVITFATYIHTEINTHKAPSDTGHNQGHRVFPQLAHEDQCSVHREYHSDTANLNNAWDVHQPR